MKGLNVNTLLILSLLGIATLYILAEMAVPVEVSLSDIKEHNGELVKVEGRILKPMEGGFVLTDGNHSVNVEVNGDYEPGYEVSVNGVYDGYRIKAEPDDVLFIENPTYYYPGELLENPDRFLNMELKVRGYASDVVKGENYTAFYITMYGYSLKVYAPYNYDIGNGFTEVEGLFTYYSYEGKYEILME